MNITTSELSPLGEKIAQLVAQEPFRCSPDSDSFVKGWSDRFLKYRWNNRGPFAYEKEFNEWEETLGILCKKVISGKRETISKSDQKKAICAAKGVFKWGGVWPRGPGNKRRLLEWDDIKAVMTNSAKYEEIKAKPKVRVKVNSTWTKLAHFSTAWMTDRDKPQQVIYDSRVAASLLKWIDCASEASTEFKEIRRKLQANGLGYIVGQGGNRKKNSPTLNTLKKNGWKSGYQKWSSQFLGSRVTYSIVEALNNKGDPMPQLDRTTDKWTVRGVEMVLFMDGY